MRRGVQRPLKRRVQAEAGVDAARLARRARAERVAWELQVARLSTKLQPVTPSPPVTYVARKGSCGASPLSLHRCMPTCSTS